ncbi:MAG: hypothetical protein LBL80_01615 [Ruminococcus sp.]|jgi:carboxyl-terminal processing protease|nr:hypothetical protein [Ruminococcus sp.]
MKKIISVLLAMALSLSLSVTLSAEEITKEQAKAYAHEILELYDVSSVNENFDEYGRGNWYALEDYLTDAIYKDPNVYADWYEIWKQSTDENSRLNSTTYLEETYEGAKKGKFGITFTVKDGEIYVPNAVYMSPAEEAGIVNGSVLISYEGIEVPSPATEQDFNAMSTVMSEEETLEITLRLPNGELKDYSIPRGDFDEDAITDKLDITGDTGYIIVPSFNAGTDERFIETYKKAEEAGLKNIIIDLRNNLGGFTDTCYNMLNAVIPEKLPTFFYTSSTAISITTSDGLGSKDWRPDIVILVNDETASAAEQFAGVLQYYGYARLVGEQTYGKAIGQNNITLSNGKILSVTALEGYLPDGSTWQNKGLTPDKVLKDDLTTEADEVLDYAYSYVDGEGTTVEQPDSYSYTYYLGTDTEREALATFAYIRQMRGMGLDMPVRFTYVSSNGMAMTVDADKAYDAAQIYYYFGILGDQSASAEKILKGAWLDEDARVIMTAWTGDFGFTPTLSVAAAKEPKYFYYYDSVAETLTPFEPAYTYTDGRLRFNIDKGGIIIVSPDELSYEPTV